jgi:cytochrome oxidase Cu insertion factor (SCO1/SenC/PrrC family)
MRRFSLFPPSLFERFLDPEYDLVTTLKQILIRDNPNLQEGSALWGDDGDEVATLAKVITLKPEESLKHCDDGDNDNNDQFTLFPQSLFERFFDPDYNRAITRKWMNRSH